MQHFLLPSLTALLLWGHAAELIAQQFSGPPRQLVRLNLHTLPPAKLQQVLAGGYDVAEVDPARGTCELIATPTELVELARLGIAYEVKIVDLEAHARALRATGYLEHFFDYERTLVELQLVQASHPDLVQVLDIGDSWEKTQNLADRDLWAVKISDNVQRDEDEPEVLIMGLHHAREIITPAIVLDYLNLLLSGYGRDPYLTYLVNNRQIWLIPIVNPDGLEYVFHEDLWWRKNRRRNDDGSFGIDLNRNYGYNWGYDNIGSSPNPRSNTYRGTAPFSEPETAAIRDFVLTRRFRLSFSYHSYGRFMIYPWGYTAVKTPDHSTFVALADSLVAYNSYLPGLGIETVGYFVNGDSDDWLYGEQSLKTKILAFTPEVGTQFHPDTSEIEQLIRENRGPNLFITYAAGEEPVIEHTPLPDPATGPGPFEIIARVLPPIVLTHPVALAENSFQVHYNTTGVPPFTSLPLTPTGNDNEYHAFLPAVGSDLTVYYYLSAADDSGRVGHAPRAASAGEYFSFHVGRATGIVHAVPDLPATFLLEQNDPNPVRQETAIAFALPAGFGGNMQLAVYNILGQQVKLLASGARSAGRHLVRWDGRDQTGRRLSPGIYFYRLQAGTFVQVKKLLLLH
ncbi:MAG: M14 family zinc carboxypeptidase [candidate division KSB1 bacterium]|nr:M14 family zinc carboxypeptidase [candidate division KSB1 bacterium]MDZ7275042.1 M14 family zinc carboxypeptidase [candidate division KSB1 bacterium]MDZ7286510.1 M14 family zinc carboxypeptidase [candidate division KSB1 bacterium]MDZ7299326.1 M14 family zinc carboxypeptidase [candidate division KSB1 bacterium]MDZ7306998.1 M14 family zinc carboxypeptidase [candidate division KSB1 bacterium]